MGIMENFPIASIQDLLSLSSQGDAPFGLLLDDQSVLEVDVIVRRVPNKRLVCQARWHQQAVYVKLFFGEAAIRYAERDRRGVENLLNAQIASPKILYGCRIQNISVLIFEALTQAHNVESLWKDSTQSERAKIAKLLAQSVALHHKANILQTDLYLKNFLLQDNRVYTIDGDGIRQFGHLTRAQAASNFAVLVSKFDVIDAESWLSDLMENYHEVYSEKFLDPHEVMRLSSSHRVQVASAYANKKVFRTCTDVRVVEDTAQYGAYSNAFFEMVEPLSIAHLEDLLNFSKPLKKGNTCTVGLAQLQGKPVVIKRYNIKSFWHGVGRAIRQTRAALSWANAHRLQLLGIATPQPVALIEQKRLSILGFTLKGKSYFLSAYVKAPDVAEFFAQTTDKVARAEAVKQIVQLFYRLYLLKVSHGDMKATNIKMPSTNPMLIDLDSMQQHRCGYFAKKAHVRDLRRFMQNWKDDTSLYNAFIKVFKVVYADHTPLRAAEISE